MPNFAYKALDANGKSSTGHIDAPSRAAAVNRLRQQGLTPFELTVVRLGSTASSHSGQKGEQAPFRRCALRTPFRRTLPKAAVAGMARQLATLLKAGLPLDQALLGISSGDKSSPMSTIVGELREHVVAGRDLADGLSAFPRVFSNTFVAMVRAGEESGTLDLVMERLAAHLEQQTELRRKIRATLAYPVLMLIIGLAVVVFLLSFVIPQVTRIFADMGRELPLPTQLLLSLSDGLRTWWWAILLAAVLAVLAVWSLGRSADGKRFLQSKFCALPGVRSIYAPILLGNMSRTLGMLLKNGVPMLKALGIVKSASDNILMRESVERMIDGVQTGRELSFYMDDPFIYPPLARQMVAAGEKSGRLEEMLLWVANDCESKVAARLHMLTALLEPVLILVLGSLVGFVVIAIIMPIFEMSTLAGQV